MLDSFQNPGMDIAAAQAPGHAFAEWTRAGKTMKLRYDPQARTAGPMPVFSAMVQENLLAAQGHAYAPAISTAMDIQIESPPKDDFSFGDVIDMVNPLQHLPVIGMIYRKVTGDTLKPISTIIGGAIFGGPLGAVTSTVNAVVKDRTGRDVAENALAMVGFDVAPAPVRGPDLVYASNYSVTNSGMPADDLRFAAASAAYTEGGKRNFARSAPQTQIWNS